jgi:2-polyprenyl-3-methyl-5-hydroxy-6-metoxy-1,4-benzoquinol methylase
MLSPDPLTPDREAELEKVLLERFFKGGSFQNADSREQQTYLRDHVRGRYDICRKWLIPWLQNLVDLRRTDIVEIGCGTGSTSAALALEAHSVDAYDIVANAADAASRRAEIMGLSNARFHHYSPESLPAKVAAAHPENSVQMVVCFAVLEHAKHQERLDLLRLMWGMLAPGGLLVIGGTPNRLSYWDFHTSWLHFFDSLPHEIAIEYLQRSPRKGLVETMLRTQKQSRDAAEEALVRAGRGVSYHEFELAIGDINPLVVGDGFDPEPLSYFGVDLETRVLYSYAKLKGLNVHPAFLRSTIEVILQKPGEADARPPRPRDVDAIVRPFCRAENWTIVAAEGNQARLFLPTDFSDDMRVAFGAVAGSEAWRVRLVSRPWQMHAAAECFVSFRARADKPRTMVCTCKQRQQPWANIGLHAEVSLTTDWQTITHTFRPKADCPAAVFAFELGGSDIAVEIADIEIWHPFKGGGGNDVGNVPERSAD